MGKTLSAAFALNVGVSGRPNVMDENAIDENATNENAKNENTKKKAHGEIFFERNIVKTRC